MDYVYLLQHSYEYGKNLEYNEVKIIGIYSTKLLAEKAVEKYKQLQGFRDYSVECFYIDKYTLDEGSWTEGFDNADDNMGKS